MYSIPELVALLGLSTENQVRNRIEAIREPLLGSLRRGPNNQILVTEDGLRLLRDLQGLCETGHTITEASHILRYRLDRNEQTIVQVLPSTAPNRAQPDETDAGWRALVEHLAAEVREIGARLATLEAATRREKEPGAWWERWR